MLNFTKGVCVLDGPVKVLSDDMIEELKAEAFSNELKRARINFHANLDDLVHEMLIAMTRETWVPVHSHPTKAESFHLIEGSVVVGFISDDAKVERVVSLTSEGTIFYRAEPNQSHVVIPTSDVVVIHEVTAGPFDPKISSVIKDFENIHELRREILERA